MDRALTQTQANEATRMVYMSSKILQLAFGSRDLSQAEKRVIDEQHSDPCKIPSDGIPIG